MMDPKYLSLPQINYTDSVLKINIFDFYLFSK
jgi:hypothetical protein